MADNMVLHGNLLDSLAPDDGKESLLLWYGTEDYVIVSHKKSWVTYFFVFPWKEEEERRYKTMWNCALKDDHQQQVVGENEMKMSFFFLLL